MTSNETYLTARALWAIRLARDAFGWDDEARAVALATGVLMGAGADAEKAKRIAARVWARDFAVTQPI